MTVAAGSAASLYVRSTSGGLPVARLGPVQLVRLADGKVMATLTTGENGVWTGRLRPARTRVYEVLLPRAPASSWARSLRPA